MSRYINLEVTKEPMNKLLQESHNLLPYQEEFTEQ